MKSERTYPVYKVNKHAEGLLVGGHPWVYENDILEAPGTAPENGTLVDVVSPKGAYLGTGFLSLKSKIRVRLISRNANDTFDTAFWRRRVEYAWAYRKTVLEPADLSACRFIFGEADQFPGLTVDRFNNVLVTQTLSVGMEKLKPVLFPLLAEVLRADGQTIDGIYERNDEALRAKEGLDYEKAEPSYTQCVKGMENDEAPAEAAHWQADFSADEVMAAANASGAKVDALESIAVGRRGESGRAETLLISGQEVSAPAFRIAIGSTKMRSCLLESLRVEDGRVKMSGKGYGHGVGMSQWGAYAMAKAGKTAEEIVMHYFRGVSIDRAWE
mgnify:CR=1 FL=1